MKLSKILVCKLYALASKITWLKSGDLVKCLTPGFVSKEEKVYKVGKIGPEGLTLLDEVDNGLVAVCASPYCFQKADN